MSAKEGALVYHITAPDGAPLLGHVAEAAALEHCELLDLSLGKTMGEAWLHCAVRGTSHVGFEARLKAFAVQHGYSFTGSEPAETVQNTACALCITLLGSVADGRALRHVSGLVSQMGFFVESARALGRPGISGLEIRITRAPGEELSREHENRLRVELLTLAHENGVDVALQRDDIFRRSKRLLCMDVDSTFVRGEFIDELAELSGVGPEVSAITARAMRGELDFKSALRERVRLLRGLPMERAKTLCDRFELSPGALELVKTAKQLGLRVGLVSGGFDFFVDLLKEKFGLDFAFANQLEVDDGVLTGEVIGTIVDSERKAQVLRDMARVYGIHLEQTIAIGDGANDMLMLEAAGLGIAYQAKPRLISVADARLSHHDRLDMLFYLMGFDAPEVTATCRR